MEFYLTLLEVIAFVELAERFSFYGSSVVFVGYLRSLLIQLMIHLF